MLKVIGIIYLVLSVIVLAVGTWLHFKGEVKDDE